MALKFCCFLLLLTLTPSVLTQCSVEKAAPYFRRSVYEFSLELMSRLSDENERHFVTSTLSPWTLLSAISLGATEETLAELKQVLRLHPHKCFTNKFFEIIKDISANNDGVKLERSSTLFVDEGKKLKDSFKRKLSTTGICDIEPLPFEYFVEAAVSINDFVSRSTHGLVDDIVSPNDLEGVQLVLIDALYFKGSWKQQFSAADTEISSFYDERGNLIGDVNLMFSQQQANITYLPNIEANVLELPYGDHGRFSMLVFLPNNGVSLATVLEKLRGISLGSIFNLFRQSGPQTVLIQIPKFEMHSDLDNLKELLTDMGLRTLFDSYTARLPEISDDPLYVANFIQKANIEVNEEGSEASASTAALFFGRSLPTVENEFNANRPFLFMIVDRQVEVPLFAGAYSRPSVF